MILPGVVGAESSGREPLIIADDRAFPPIIFLDADGQARGITTDIWELWSKKTGIPVKFQLTDWNRALNSVLEGEADAIGGLFRTPSREATFSFSDKIFEIPSGIFYHQRIKAVDSIEDLLAFRVGVVRGDSSEELLRARYDHPALELYPGTDALVEAAVSGKIEVFMADIPVANYYLSKVSDGNLFRQSAFTLLNDMHVGVRKGNSVLLETIDRGLKEITESEYQRIILKWTGHPAVVHTSRRALYGWGAIAVGLLALIGLWNFQLRRRVMRATGALIEKNRELQGSLEELQQSEEKFRMMFDLAPYPIVINRLSDGVLLRANQSFLSAYNLTAADLANYTTYSLWKISPSERRWLSRQLLETGMVEKEILQLKRDDGSLRQVLFSSVLMPVDGLDQVLSITIDITRQHDAEQALQDSERKYRSLINNLPIGIFRTNIEGKFLEANETIARMFGYTTSAELTYQVRNIPRQLYPDVEERQKVIDAVKESPAGAVVEVEFKRQDGSTFFGRVHASLHSNEMGLPLYLDGAIEDITSLRQTENELRLLAAATEQTGEMIIITDLEGVIEYVNHAFEIHTGYSRQEVLGRKASLLKSGEHLDSFYADLWGTIVGGNIWKGRLVNRKSNGELYTEETTISPVFDSEGAITNYVAAKRDITQELLLEEQNRKMQKLEAIGQLTGGVAHDFNNILQAVNGYADLALTKLDQTDPLFGYLTQIRRAGGKAATLIEQLLLFSRKSVMRLRPLDLNELITDLLKMLDRLLGEQIIVQWRPLGEDLVVDGDSSMLDQVVVNLCVNSRDAMPNGGTLMIETGRAAIDQAYCRLHAWASPGSYATITVSDNGIGMDRETIDHIFEPFFTTKEEGKGTGLGLATVFGIVKQHRGMINVYSEPGHGTTFRVYLPLSARLADAEASFIEIEASAAGGSEMILFAEDDEMIRELGSTILLEAGYRVVSAVDGREACALYEQYRDQISLLLFDVIMPHRSGPEAYLKIRKLDPEVKVIFTSGYSGFKPELIENDRFLVLQKPYSPNSLLTEVRTALDR